MFNCNLCNQSDEYVISNLCSKCDQIRKIIELYDVEKVLSTLRFVYLRDQYDKIEKREGVECKKNDDDKVKTRSQKKNDEEKENKK